MQSGNGASVRKKLITVWERLRKAGVALNAVGAYWKDVSVLTGNWVRVVQEKYRGHVQTVPSESEGIT